MAEVDVHPSEHVEIELIKPDPIALKRNRLLEMLKKKRQENNTTVFIQHDYVPKTGRRRIIGEWKENAKKALLPLIIDEDEETKENIAEKEEEKENDENTVEDKEAISEREEIDINSSDTEVIERDNDGNEVEKEESDDEIEYSGDDEEEEEEETKEEDENEENEEKAEEIKEEKEEINETIINDDEDEIDEDNEIVHKIKPTQPQEDNNITINNNNNEDNDGNEGDKEENELFEELSSDEEDNNNNVIENEAIDSDGEDQTTIQTLLMNNNNNTKPKIKESEYVENEAELSGDDDSGDENIDDKDIDIEGLISNDNNEDINISALEELTHKLQDEKDESVIRRIKRQLVYGYHRMKRKGMDRNGILRSILKDEDESDESDSEDEGYDESLDDDEVFVRSLVKYMKKKNQENNDEDMKFPEYSPNIFEETPEDEAAREEREAKEMEERVRLNRIITSEENKNKVVDIMDDKTKEILNMIRCSNIKHNKNTIHPINMTHSTNQHNVSSVLSYTRSDSNSCYAFKRTHSMMIESNSTSSNMSNITQLSSKGYIFSSVSRDSSSSSIRSSYGNNKRIKTPKQPVKSSLSESLRSLLNSAKFGSSNKK